MNTVIQNVKNRYRCKNNLKFFLNVLESFGRESGFLAHTMTTTNLSVVGSGPICAPIYSYGKTRQTSVTYVYKTDMRSVTHT